ncbi:MAG: Gfo/Idh/MocA family oxidoreductase [Anaerolineales bacterium]|nr:Gfo/Idh/MocA family oxidoreductase [Anaerolineales bacterium]MCB0005482.1 Gfo/Idh/MocA family oxidoreductase [Anaerolineales bacterium]MCB8960257.1 Gfo/Idh/MocA family oxidoreductase [Ardenticatenales bacterium]
MQRVAVIGLGPIGNRHCDMYQADELADLVGVCDIIKERADAAAARLGVPAFYSVPEMLKALAPDVCSVATGGEEYGSDHYEPTMQALEGGCHVLGEKPISNVIEEAEEMVATAAKHNRCYAINLNHRFTPAARIAKQWVDEGRLGHMLFVNMAMWIMNPRESSPYFQLKALHPHTVDVMRYYCGDIEAVQCFATKAPGRKIWSTAQFNMRFKNGVVGSLTGSYDIERGHPMERCEVAGTGGRFVLEDMFRELTLYPAGNLQKTVYTDPVFGGFHNFPNTFKSRIHAFLEQVDAGVAPEDIDGSGADGLAAQKVLAAAIESLETETVVYVK